MLPHSAGLETKRGCQHNHLEEMLARVVGCRGLMMVGRGLPEEPEWAALKAQFIKSWIWM